MKMIKRYTVDGKRAEMHLLVALQTKAIGWPALGASLQTALSLGRRVRSTKRALSTYKTQPMLSPPCSCFTRKDQIQKASPSFPLQLRWCQSQLTRIYGRLFEE